MYSLPMSPATAKAVSEMPSEDLIAFLKDNGWREAGPFGAYAVRFLSPEPETEKAVIVPISREIADYEWLMINASIEITKQRKIPVEYILWEIMLHKTSRKFFEAKEYSTEQASAYRIHLEESIKDTSAPEWQQRKSSQKLTYKANPFTEITAAGVTMTPRTTNIKSAK
ncbi:MAG TPA: hypothetical protein PKZ97_07215 [Azospirillaceae bacterium]|nr:hypothetical protein [Azospirillaceae bacterium]HRQ80892.1 hypothetical protein [Azospirillaceae bacterium]